MKGWIKLAVFLLFAGLIIGALVGIAFLLLLIFVSVFNSLADMMIIKGADSNWAAIVALVLTVYIFFAVSKNKTVNNYISSKTQGVLAKKFNLEDD